MELCTKCGSKINLCYCNLVDIGRLKDSGERQLFDSGAVRDTQEGKGRMDFLPAFALMEVAKHFEAGANKYGDNNWRKGIPVSRYIDSGLRHLLKHMDGQTDEQHLIAATWNLLCAIETREKLPELNDMPYKYGGGAE